MINRKFVAALVTFGLASPAVTRAQDAPVEEQIVNQMNKVFGIHAGFRANHAKGVVAEGKFKASQEGAGLSKAVLFSGAEIPVTVLDCTPQVRHDNLGDRHSEDDLWQQEGRTVSFRRLTN